MVGCHSSSSSGVESIIPVSTRMRPSGRSITCRWPGHGSPSTITSATWIGRTSASRIDLPRPGHALELVLAALLEGDPRAGDEVAHRARDEDLTRPGQRRDPRAGVDGDPAHLPVRELALAGVEPCAELEPEAAHAVADRARGADRACGPVEGGEEAVAGGVDLAPAVARELAADGGLVRLEQLAPAPVAELGSTLR